MSVAVRPSSEADLAAFLASVAVHGALVLLPLVTGLYGHVGPRKVALLPNSVTMQGNSIEIEAPTPELAAAAPTPAAAAEPEPIDVKSLPAEPAPAADSEPTQPRPTPHPKPTAKPRPASETSTPSNGSSTPTSGAPAVGTFGQEGLAPGVRRLGYAFTRAIPAASPGDSAWRELPAGHVGTIRIELAVDESSHLGELKHWQAHPSGAAAPAVLERMVERTLILLRAGQFALSGSNQPGSERLLIDVSLRDEAADAEGADVVVQKKFEGAAPGHAGSAYFRYGTGRVVEAKVTIVSSGK